VPLPTAHPPRRAVRVLGEDQVSASRRLRDAARRLQPSADQLLPFVADVVAYHLPVAGVVTANLFPTMNLEAAHQLPVPVVGLRHLQPVVGFGTVHLRLMVSFPATYACPLMVIAAAQRGWHTHPSAWWTMAAMQRLQKT